MLFDPPTNLTFHSIREAPQKNMRTTSTTSTTNTTTTNKTKNHSKIIHHQCFPCQWNVSEFFFARSRGYSTFMRYFLEWYHFFSPTQNNTLSSWEKRRNAPPSPPVNEAIISSRHCSLTWGFGSRCHLDLMDDQVWHGNSRSWHCRACFFSVAAG